MVGANRKAEEYFHRPLTEIIGKHCREITHCTRESIKECPGLRAGRNLVREDMELKIGNSWFRVTVDPILNSEGIFTGSAHMVRDITEYRRAEKILRDNEYSYHTLFNRMLNAYVLHEIICDESGKPVDYRFLDLNPAFERITGRDRGILGKTILEIAPDVDPHLIETYGKVALTGEPVAFEYLSEKTGRYFLISVYQPEERQFACIFQDITDLKQAEKALRESEQKFRILADNPIVGLFITQGRKYIYVNDRFAEMHGYRKEEIIGQPYNALIPPDERKTFRSSLNERLSIGENFKQRFEMLRIRKNGDTFWGGAIVTGGEYNGKPAVMGSVIDISESREAEEELKKAHDELEQHVQTRTEELRKANEALKQSTFRKSTWL